MGRYEEYLAKHDEMLQLAEKASMPDTKNSYLICAKNYLEMAKMAKSMEEDKAVDAVVVEPEKKSIWDYILAAATPIATIIGSIATVIAAICSGRSVVEAKRIDVASRMQQLRLICRTSETTLPDTLSLKTLNENNKL